MLLLATQRAAPGHSPDMRSLGFTSDLVLSRIPLYNEFPVIQMQGELMASWFHHCPFMIELLVNVFGAQMISQSVLSVP